MCGINGYFSSNNVVGESRVMNALGGMNAAVRHRGPDDSGKEYLSGHCWSLGLGHTRLSIIDLSESGHQPMLDEATGNTIVFNGEIYNFKDIRSRLEGEGVVLKSNSDTEVILKSYACWGHSCVEHFRGIFAFAIWDKHNEELFLARDQLGVKPLYYYAGDAFLLSSEVRGLLASSVIPRKLSREGLWGYLQAGFVQEPSTLIEGVHSVPPASTIVLSALDERKTYRYWELPDPMSLAPDEGVVLDSVRHTLDEAIRYQQVSDAPIGVFLSGGIDSSAIASLACLQNPGKINTFCIGFEEDAYNESHYAREIASQIGSNHSELIMRGEDVRSHWEDALSAYNQPSYDGLNTYFISKLLTESGLKVALSGLGGDEVFAGYDGFGKMLKVARLARLLQFVPPMSGVLGSRFHVHPAMQVLSELNGRRSPSPYFASRLLFGSLNIEWLLGASSLGSNKFSWMRRNQGLAVRASGFDSINEVSFLELRHYILNQLLRDSDQMSMAHFLELRVPLLDHRLVESVFKYPGSIKTSDSLQKPLLVKALKDILPEIVYNHPKQGFVFPFERWFKKDLRGPLEDFFKQPKAALWDKKRMQHLWVLFERGKLSWSRVWSLFILNDWMKRNNITP